MLPANLYTKVTACAVCQRAVASSLHQVTMQVYMQVAVFLAGVAGCCGIKQLLQANLKQQEDELVAALDREAAVSTAKYWSGDKE